MITPAKWLKKRANTKRYRALYDEYLQEKREVYGNYVILHTSPDDFEDWLKRNNKDWRQP